MKKLSILLVDDARDFAEILVWHLCDSGHSVVYAPNGREGAAELNKTRFDLVITDIIMPISDGFELIAAVKKTQPAARIVAISGGGNLYSAQACLRDVELHGVDGVLLKPFGPARLAEELHRLFPEEPEGKKAIATYSRSCRLRWGDRLGGAPQDRRSDVGPLSLAPGPWSLVPRPWSFSAHTARDSRRTRR